MSLQTFFDICDNTSRDHQLLQQQQAKNNNNNNSITSKYVYFSGGFEDFPGTCNFESLLPRFLLFLYSFPFPSHHLRVYCYAAIVDDLKPFDFLDIDIGSDQKPLRKVWMGKFSSFFFV